MHQISINHMKISLEDKQTLIFSELDSIVQLFELLCLLYFQNNIKIYLKIFFLINW